MLSLISTVAWHLQRLFCTCLVIPLPPLIFTISDSNSSLKQARLNLSPNAHQIKSLHQLLIPEILSRLGYSDHNHEITQGYYCGKDVEVSRRAMDSSMSTSMYNETVRQLKP